MTQPAADLPLDRSQTDAQYQVGLNHLVQGELDEAIACFRQVLRVRPDMPAAHGNLGAALQLQGKLHEAVASFEESIRHQSNVVESHYNLGVALRDVGEWERGLAALNDALRVDPKYALAHLARAYAWLQAGDFERGWAEFEWRWATPIIVPPPLFPPRPAWDGSPLKGRTILLRNEQGLGDGIQFARFIPVLHEMGAQVLLETYSQLISLMQTCPQVAAVYSSGQCPAEYDLHVFLLSIPRLLRTTLDTIPAKVPYLWADPSLVARWGEGLRGVSGFKIGIVWQGSPTHPRDSLRSVRLTDFAPLAAVPGVRLFSLQVATGSDQLTTHQGRFPVTDLGSHFDTASLADVAAVIMNLDLVVTVDTAIAHLAGALGRPVWLALSLNPDWRWHLGRDDSPWYPTMRLFRQTVPGQWSDVFERIANEAHKALADAYYRLGNGLCEQARWQDAVGCFQEALRHNPDLPGVHNNLGAVLLQQDQPAAAMASLEQALRLEPEYADALSNLGVAYQRLNRRDGAVDTYQRALRANPEHIDALGNLATLLLTQGKAKEAIGYFQRLLRLRPELSEMHHKLGAALQVEGRLDESVASNREAIRLRPASPGPHADLGLALLALCKIQEALAELDTALELQPDFAPAHASRGMALLLTGDFARGWPEYEWRLRCPELAPKVLRCPQPEWDGSSLEGRTVLLRAEQGLGDTVQFVRYLPQVRQRGGRIVLQAQAALFSLLRTVMEADERLIAMDDTPPRFDVHASFLSLPGLLGTTLANVPADVPYLSADPALVEQWRNKLRAYPGFKVGIVWQGSPDHTRDRLRSVPLAAFAPLAEVEGVQLLSLQVGAGREQLAALEDRFPVADLNVDADQKSFAEAAAVAMSLDLVITVDTAMAHLAGALGAPVWVILSTAPDWRWLLQREDSPWYPTMRLFRERKRGDFSTVFANVASELVNLVAQRHP
jgi:tetratricopeptide (TPR) repeat protein